MIRHGLLDLAAFTNPNHKLHEPVMDWWNNVSRKEIYQVANYGCTGIPRITISPLGDSWTCRIGPSLQQVIDEAQPVFTTQIYR